MRKASKALRTVGSAPALVLIMALGLVVGLQAPADATVPCGSLCDGAAPSYSYRGTHCSEDYIVATTRTVQNFTVELRYSPWCQTAWAYTPLVGYDIRVRSYRSNGQLRLVVDGGVTNNTYHWSPMVDDNGVLTADACVDIPYGDWLCTTPRF